MTHVLIVEPDSSHAAQIAQTLDGERLTLVSNLEEAAQAIAKGGIDIGVCPTGLFLETPVFAEFRSISWILLTETADEEIAMHRDKPELTARYLYKDAERRYLDVLPYRLRATTSHERVMSTIADRFPALVAYWDKNERCLFANHAYADRFGNTIPSMLGMSLREVLGPIYEINEPYIRGVLQGEPQQFERELPAIGPKPLKHILATYAPDIRDGVVQGFVVFVSDIEEQYQLRQQLLAREKRWATLFDILPVGVTVLDSERNIIDQNQAITSILQINPDELQRQPKDERKYLGIDGLPIAAHEFPSVRAIAERKVVGPVEIGIVRPNSSVIWTSVIAAPLPNEDKVVVVTRDITTEKANAARFKAIVDASPIPYAINDDALNITYLNPAFISLFGYTPNDIPTVAHWWPLAYPDPTSRDSVRQEWLKRLQRTKFEKVPFEPMELSIRAKDGSQKLAMVGAVPLEGHLEGENLVVFVDITELRRAERQLEESRRLAGLGSLAGGIAHDFNNLLTPILVNAEVALADLPAGHPLAESLAEIRTAATRATHLIRQLLAMSRPGDESQTRVDLVAVVEEAIYLLRASLPSTISIVANLKRNAPTVFANATRIHRVITNLITNARDAMAEQGGTLTISVEQTIDNQVQLTVKDTGIGIASEALARVFEPYYTTKRASGGTGLGLATVRSIITSLGGTVCIESEPGKGTSVTVLLPGMQDLRASRRLPSEPGLNAVATNQSQSHVLVVDDEAMVARAAARMVGRLGYRTTTAESPRQALQIFQSDPSIMAVVTDFMMPEMNGIELARALNVIRPIPIILATGYAGRLTDETTKNANVLRVLAKPFGADSLSDALTAAFAQKN